VLNLSDTTNTRSAKTLFDSVPTVAGNWSHSLDDTTSNNPYKAYPTVIKLPNATIGRVLLMLSGPGGCTTSVVFCFRRVHVALHHSGGTVAVDTTFDVPLGTDSLVTEIHVALLPGAPAAGEDMTLKLDYINPTGVTVFSGGPISITVAAIVVGQPAPTPIRIPVAYTGPGAAAVRVRIAPRSGTAVAGNTFNFTATAQDATGATIPGTPIFWLSLDPAIASPASAASGTIITHAQDSARIVAQLLTGPVDTVTLTVQMAATTR
jgi:hypothetical protein